MLYETRMWLRKFWAGVVLGLALGISLGAFAIYGTQADKVDSLVYGAAKKAWQAMFRKPEGVSLFDWNFSCRDKRDCP